MRIARLYPPPREYDFIFSLGEACFVASSLINNNLRTASSPFDWVPSSNFEGRLSILLNKFKDYINIQYLKYHSSSLKFQKDVYSNTKNGIMFLHDFPINIPLEQSYHQIREKYDRRINRLLNLLYNKEKHLLGVFSNLYYSKEPVKIETAIAFSKKFENKFSAKLDLLLILHNENLGDGEIKYEQISDRIILSQCNNKPMRDLHIASGNQSNMSCIYKTLGIAAKGFIYKTKKKIVIYGAGKEAEKILYWIRNGQILSGNFEGFVITDGHDKPKNLPYPIYWWKELPFSYKDIDFLLGLNEDNKKQVKEFLSGLADVNIVALDLDP